MEVESNRTPLEDVTLDFELGRGSWTAVDDPVADGEASEETGAEDDAENDGVAKADADGPDAPDDADAPDDTEAPAYAEAPDDAEAPAGPEENAESADEESRHALLTDSCYDCPVRCLHPNPLLLTEIISEFQVLESLRMWGRSQLATPHLTNHLRST